ncbi:MULTISPECIES: carbon-nitrogen hydrolase family protein [unclassified Arthrobacter]|jgi:predicted amidohydrolase|uniref:carbon-nitrogen hydrolase family protein n=1 Tax=unclassified Arthrobacter TaxID=235627 RepID=UPI001CC3E3F4|nr:MULTISPECIES: carbon-nitrogen hydrolase family protein [unclassified Arthrobacter]MDE8587426.1 carbon-nitrogen hydrolase family protein [Arthrobacter sp. NQ4]BCW80149.1 hydrolase [Arthrobacter sp. NicSoilC5]
MRIAVAQIISSADTAANLELVWEYAAQASNAGAQLVVFPEATMRAFGHSLKDIAEPVDGPWASEVRRMAKELDLTIVAGMFTPGKDGRVRNTLLVTGPGVEASYDKVHLFDAFGFAESRTVEAGEAPVTFELDGTVFGLATCYDVRFPGLFTANANAGAQVNIVCASWGAGEGKAEQWDLLVRARALDSTTFVVACGQGDPETVGAGPAGTAPTGIGHSAVITPLGKAVVALGGKPELAVVDIDPSTVDDVRTKLPVLANARTF